MELHVKRLMITFFIYQSMEIDLRTLLTATYTTIDYVKSSVLDEWESVGKGRNWKNQAR